MKDYLILLLILQIISGSVNQPVQNPFDFDNSDIDVQSNKYRYKKDLNSQSPFCNNTQYFDGEQKRCIDIVGGGTLLYVNKTKSCGVNVLKPHCGNPKHYYICKKNEAILAQCGRDQYFSFHLHKCVHVSRQEEVTKPISSGQRTFDSIKLPACKKSGSFPVLNDCTLFYTCETKDRRMSQTVFKCPRTMVYDAETEMCSISATCDNIYLNVSSICEPNAEGRIALLHREHELEDETTSIYESEITSTTDSDVVQMPLASDKFNDFEGTNSTEDILNTLSSSSTIDVIASTTTSENLALSLQTETTDPSLQTSTWDEEILNKQFDVAETTTEDSLTSEEPLETTATVESSNDQNDEVTPNTMYSTSTSDFTSSNPIVGAANPQIIVDSTALGGISTSTEINTNEPSVDSSTQQGSRGLNEEERSEHPTTEFSWIEFTSTISSIELFTSSGSGNESTASNSDMLVGNSRYLNKLLTSTEDASTTPIESFANSALSDESVPDIVGAFNDAAFSTSTDAANFVSTEPAENMAYKPGELNDTSNDMEQIIQNFTSTLNAVSVLESALDTNGNSPLDSSDSKLNSNSSTEANKQSCEDMLQSLLARLEKNETAANEQDVTASHELNPRRTISSHIALPLATRLLNITGRFEHRLRDILNKIPKSRT
ncbi:uncharacterized protein LOC143361704 [Halictus rubicundus]|uniref:uncharacterized protein LOC143361704 n=1 Tax=Halictus rubicundus TaxID=77578 RepID=UPI00403690C8